MRQFSQRYLIISIHNRSWGRTEMAIRVGNALMNDGKDILLLIHNSLQPLLVGTKIPHEIISDHLGGLAKLVIDKCVQKFNPYAIIFFDYFNTVNYLLQLGIKNSRFLINYNCQKITLDTWDYNSTGCSIDILGGASESLIKGDVDQKVSEFNLINHRIIPVPISNVDSIGNKFYCLSETAFLQKTKINNATTKLQSEQKVILFCTALWQHRVSNVREIVSMSKLFPRLLAHYIKMTGSSIKLVHVGPEPYPIGNILGSNYHWLGSLDKTQFEILLQSVDLFITANVSATTIALAFQFNVPVLLCQNSYSIICKEDAEKLFNDKCPIEVIKEIVKAFPIFPFSLWPIGYFSFLKPLLRNNIYYHTLQPVEVFNWTQTLERILKLLYDSNEIIECINRQNNYLNKVKQLPSINALLSRMM